MQIVIYKKQFLTFQKNEILCYVYENLWSAFALSVRATHSVS